MRSRSVFIGGLIIGNARVLIGQTIGICAARALIVLIIDVCAAGDLRKLVIAQLRELSVQGFEFFLEGI